MCVMSPLPKTAPASAQATLLRFWLPVATWLLLLFIAQGLLTSLLPVASFPTIPPGLSTSCFPEPPPSNNSQALPHRRTARSCNSDGFTYFLSVFFTLCYIPNNTYPTVLFSR